MTPRNDKSTSEAVAIKATLIDITKCIGCRACQVACKQWNDRDGEDTELQELFGFQNPASLSADTYTLISFHELVDETAPGGLRSAYAMRRCLHCLEPACVSACPTTALTRQIDGPVTYDADPCIGCRYCMLACPWGVPTAEWDSPAPKIEKCTHCADRADQPIPLTRNGVALTDVEQATWKKNVVVPACVKACPADCLVYREREDLLGKARDRIAKHPDKYVNHIYGEKEAGGTSVLYLSAVPFEKIGFPKLSEKPYTSISKIALKVVPFAVMAMGGLLAAAYARFRKRAAEVAGARGHAGAHDSADDHHAHPEFEMLPGKLLTPFNWAMLVLMGLGVFSIVARFVLGLGGGTNLSDTYPWGLWIVFDLVWIAIAAGAFATAGLIYVFQRKDLYALGRSAVLMGLLSYTFVSVTLIADLGLPWHFYQLALRAPEHSAMFEVSWCVGLYVSILALEFLPVPLEHFGWKRLHDAWKKWSGAYVAGAMTLFVWMLSRNVAYAAATAAIFSTVAWLFRWRGKASEPVLLAIAAVTLSMMHQSSLGSLFLLMQDQLAKAWWSPTLPISFFLSSIAAGTGLVIVVDFWIAKGWKRPLRLAPLAAMGKITFWSLLVYLVFRVGDLFVRGQAIGTIRGPLGSLLAIELVVGGIVPLYLLATAARRARPRVLFTGALLAVAGIVLHRTNVVLLAMNLKGTMPQTGAEPYHPSFYEWGISIGLIAATIFLFGLGARRLPLLPKRSGASAPAHS